MSATRFRVPPSHKAYLEVSTPHPLLAVTASVPNPTRIAKRPRVLDGLVPGPQMIKSSRHDSASFMTRTVGSALLTNAATARKSPIRKLHPRPSRAAVYQRSPDVFQQSQPQSSLKWTCSPYDFIMRSSHDDFGCAGYFREVLGIFELIDLGIVKMLR